MSQYKHFTFESNTFGLADLLIEIETTQEPDFDPRDFIANSDRYDSVTDNGIVTIEGNSGLPESFISQ